MVSSKQDLEASSWMSMPRYESTPDSPSIQQMEEVVAMIPYHGGSLITSTSFSVSCKDLSAPPISTANCTRHTDLSKQYSGSLHGSCFSDQRCYKAACS